MYTINPSYNKFLSYTLNNPVLPKYIRYPPGVCFVVPKDYIIKYNKLFYLQSRGLDMEKCISMIVNGFCGEVFKELPLEFSVEAVKLLEMKLENSVG